MPSPLLQWQGGAKRAFLSILSIWVWRHYPAESTREAFVHSYFLHRLINTLLSSRHQLLLITVLLMHLWGLLFSYFMTLPDWCLTFRWMSALAPALGKSSLVQGLPGMDIATSQGIYNPQREKHLQCVEHVLCTLNYGKKCKYIISHP